ncbi:MAG: 4Fe-4S dicluster domain-containing protein, partial [Clostridiales bacterium]|nr:4Fe-4S dicluster domain-containing protein [Clostridiales bacterium]
VCGSTGCRASGSISVHDKFVEVLKANNVTDVKVNQAGCFGLCAMGPIVIVYPEATFYVKVKEADIDRIVTEHIIGGKPVEDLLVKDANGDFCYNKQSVDFYEKQQFIARMNSEYINPECIEDYIALDGYFALHKCLTQMKPEEVIELVSRSGLRGRGGAGFPTGKKWELTRASEGNEKYVMCNADEGDPGAFMDRSIIEANPHAIVEAMAIAGYAIGANTGVVYIRAEYPLAGERIKKAIADAKALGLLGKNIFGSGFDFDITIKLGAGAFVCGEETALIRSCEGYRGEPTSKPPYPAVKGYLGKPTSINNVETYANIPHIILNGAEWYSKIGTDTSKGTKVFALSGKVNHTGLVELAMGTTIREIVYGIGGGIPNGKEFKAVQMGGPSGGCITAKDLDTPIDYENLKSLGSMMGSGGMIVMDEDTCMVDIAKYFLEFSVDESCGKCTPCRIGNKRLLELLQKICDGRGEMEDLDELEELANYVKDNSLCGLGQCSPNPVLSTLRYFKDEYIEHIRDKKCRAGVCKNLVTYEIDKSKCIGCSACSRKCPVNAIKGVIKSPFEIDQDICVKCGTCVATCRFGAIRRK